MRAGPDLFTPKKMGKYEFATRSDDGSRLFVEGKEIVKNYGTHPAQLEKGSVELKAGYHAIVLEYFQGGGGAECILGWAPPGHKGFETIPAKELSHTKGTEKIEFDEAAWKKRPEGKKKLPAMPRSAAAVAVPPAATRSTKNGLRPVP